uniref:Uncharacterized protein n=1 Tax=Rhizophora mucronata TaxID=61149 RepID=A0A2P2NPQ3_RHIMU
MTIIRNLITDWSGFLSIQGRIG